MTTQKKIYPGSFVDLDMTVKLKTGTLIDPTSLDVTVMDPQGNETLYSYPLGIFVHNSTGSYTLTIPIPRTHSSEGMWRYVPVPSGYAIPVVEHTFRVEISQFDIPD